MRAANECTTCAENESSSAVGLHTIRLPAQRQNQSLPSCTKSSM